MQNAAYEFRISDWSSNMCSSDLVWIYIFACRHKKMRQSGEYDIGTKRAKICRSNAAHSHIAFNPVPGVDFRRDIHYCVCTERDDIVLSTANFNLVQFSTKTNHDCI